MYDEEAANGKQKRGFHASADYNDAVIVSLDSTVNQSATTASVKVKSLLHNDSIGFANHVTITKNGPGVLYYSLSLRAAQRILRLPHTDAILELPSVKPLPSATTRQEESSSFTHDSLVIERWYVPVEGALYRSTFGYVTQIGSLLQVVIRLRTSRERFNVGVEGTDAACFEPILEGNLNSKSPRTEASEWVAFQSRR